MPASKVRVGGSGLTVFTWGASGSPLAYLQTIQDTAPTPVAQAVPVQSITDQQPSEIVTALAVGAGTLRLTFYETWNHAVWELIPGFDGKRSLLQVLNAQLGQPNGIVCQKVIKISDGTKLTPVAFRTKNYQNCVIVDVDDGEQVNIGSMVMPKGITIMYTHYTVT